MYFSSCIRLSSLNSGYAIFTEKSQYILFYNTILLSFAPCNVKYQYLVIEICGSWLQTWQQDNKGANYFFLAGNYLLFVRSICSTTNLIRRFIHVFLSLTFCFSYFLLLVSINCLLVAYLLFRRIFMTSHMALSSASVRIWFRQWDSYPKHSYYILLSFYFCRTCLDGLVFWMYPWSPSPVSISGMLW